MNKKEREVYQYIIPPLTSKFILMESMDGNYDQYTPPEPTLALIQLIESFELPNEIKIDETENISMESFAKSYANISKYPKKTYIEKLGTLQNLAHIAHDIGKKKVMDTLLPMLSYVAKEQFYDLKLEMLKHLPEIIDMLNDQGEGYAKIRDLIWPCVKALQNEEESVSEQANLIILKLAGTFTEDDVGIYILSHVLSLIHDTENVECKIKALSLLNILSPKLGKNYCQQYVVHEIASFASETDQQLRKSVCHNFIKIAETVGSEIFSNKLFPVYKSLAEDSIWSVKKAAVDVIVEVSKLCLPILQQSLTKIIETLLHDSNKWIKQACHERLGPFMISLPKHIISNELIDNFIQLSERKKSTDEELYFCAYYMPGVLLTIGEKIWPQLQTAYKALLAIKLPNIRETLASSIHEFFKILSAPSHQLLFETFDQFILTKGIMTTQILL